MGITTNKFGFAGNQIFCKEKTRTRLNVKDILANIQPLNNPINFDNKVYNKKSNQVAPLWSQRFGTTISLQVSYKF